MHCRTRFAPSPTGLLHVGNAYSALCCARWAEHHDAELILRIEDIDHSRCRPAYADALIEDMHWLGLKWQGAVQYQSQRSQAYMQAIVKLREMNMIYPCFCTRKEIKEEMLRMASAPHREDLSLEYPGTCKNRSVDEQVQRMRDEPFAWRLDVDKALAAVGNNLTWQDEAGVRHAHDIHHDIVIGRKDISFSYHLAVVIDDAAQGITDVIRGDDLRESTGIHRMLQALLGLPEPVYHHHPLLCGLDGERLAKRNGGLSLQHLRQIGVDAGKMGDFLFQLEPLVWPYAADQTTEILDVLGNRS